MFVPGGLHYWSVQCASGYLKFDFVCHAWMPACSSQNRSGLWAGTLEKPAKPKRQMH